MRTSLFIVGRTYCHSPFYPVFLPSLFQVLPEAESVVMAELSAQVVVLVAEPEVVFVVAEFSSEVVFFAAEPGVVSVADIAEPQVSADIAANMMGGGREMLMLTSTLAIVGKGSTSTNAKSIVPKSNFFIL